MRSTPASQPVCLTERTAGIDWFRYRVEDLRQVRSARDVVAGIQQEDVDRGSRRRPWTFQGYEGWITDSIRYGERGGKLLWETSGGVAPFTWTRMPLSGGTATRIDLQQTLRLASSLPDFGMRFLPPEARTHRRLLRSRRKVGISSDSRGLWCGTVGRRTAPSYLRFYDKGTESKGAELGRLWRVELETKYQHAEALCSQAVDRMKDPDWCASYCEQSWKSAGCLWPIRESAAAFVGVNVPPRPPATAGRLAQWLIHSVKPVIPRLLKVFTVAEVLAMLDLDLVAQPRRRLGGEDSAVRGEAA